MAAMKKEEITQEKTEETGKAAETETGAVTTPAQSLRPAKKNGTDVRVVTSAGEKTFRVFSQQRMEDPWFYHHGCAVCALTTILRTWADGCGMLTPQECHTRIEKEVFGEDVWARNERRPLIARMPVSMAGMAGILSAYGLPAEYVRRFEKEDAVRRMEEHLYAGGQALVETTFFPGRRWAGSKHTMAVLGMTGDGRAIIADSADRGWSGKWQRIKLAELSDLAEAMFPCTTEKTYPYYRGKAMGGGYILTGPGIRERMKKNA